MGVVFILNLFDEKITIKMRIHSILDIIFIHIF